LGAAASRGVDQMYGLAARDKTNGHARGLGLNGRSSGRRRSVRRAVANRRSRS
jgi:hypothetical protein